MEVLKWNIPEELLLSPEVTNRDTLAEKYQTVSIDKILTDYHSLSMRELREFYTRMFGVLAVELKGVGVELGAGVAAFSSFAVTQYPKIEKIYAIELVPKVVDLLQPSVVTAICGTDKHKVLSVNGSFDDISFPDHSIDFAMECDSFHHSHDLKRTLREVGRVLKPEGVLLIVDRVNTDRLSETQCQYMLGVEYSREWKESYGFDTKVAITRAMSGEHEYRYAEWKEALEYAGFTVERRAEFRRVSYKRVVLGLIAFLPFSIRKRFNFFPMISRFPRGEIFWQVSRLIGVRYCSKTFVELPECEPGQRGVMAKTVLSCRKL